MRSPFRNFWIQSMFATLAAASLVMSALGQSASVPFTNNSQTNIRQYDSSLVTAAVAASGGTRDYWYSGPRWGLSYPGDYLSSSLPPLPPALGDDLPHSRAAGTITLPASDFTREIFYGPYAVLLQPGQISLKDKMLFDHLAEHDAYAREFKDKFKAWVVAYLTTREQLLQEIRGKFDELRSASGSVRLAGLADLARQQSERLRILSAKAEHIRRRQAGTGVLYHRFGESPALLGRDNGPNEQTESLAKALYNSPDLSTEQRLLLPEIIYGTTVLGSRDDPASSNGRDYLYFLPATARIRLPANLPPELSAKIKAFAAEKEKIKNELRTAVLRDENVSHIQSTPELKALAAQQALRFAALEKLAEEIRVGLADYDLTNEPEATDLPADLTRRIWDFNDRKVALQRELAAQLHLMRAAHGGAQFAIARQGTSLAIVQTDKGAPPIAELTAFNARTANRYEILTGDLEKLNRDIEQYAAANAKRVAGTVDDVAAAFARAYAARENWNRYEDYRRAVAEPGLSPAQRQILFQAAAEGLDRAGWLPRS